MRSIRLRNFQGNIIMLMCLVLFIGCAQSGPVEVIEIDNPRKINLASTPDLVIKWKPDTFSLYLQGDSLITTDGQKADMFIKQRISGIDKSKVIFIGQTGSSHQQFKEIKDILVKYDIMKFQALSPNEVY